MGSRVGSSGIQCVTQFRKCTFCLRLSAISGWDPEWDPVGSNVIECRKCTFCLRLCNFRVGSRVGSSGIQRDRIQKMYVLLETICNFRVGSRMGSSGIRRDRSWLEGWRAFAKVVFWSRLLVERRSFSVVSRSFLNPCKENCVSQFMRRCWQAC